MVKQRGLRCGVAALVIMSTIHAVSSDDVYSRSFWADNQSRFRTGFPLHDTMFRSRRMDAKCDGIGGAVEVVGYFSKYQEDKENKHLSRFFMPFGLTQLNVIEYKVGVTDGGTNPSTDNSDLNPSKNIEARNFNIQTSSTTTTYSGSIRFCPKQEIGGIGFSWMQTLWRDCETETPKLWFQVSFPVEMVKRQLILRETVFSDGGGAAPVTGLDGAPRVGNMTQAFKQMNWNYGRIDGKCRHEWKVANVEVKLGWETYWSECCQLDGYIGFVAPTGTKVDKCVAKYIFSPVVGNNHHWEFILGNNYHVDAWQHNEHAVRLNYNMNSQIIFKNEQWRMVGLKDKDWSWFQEVYSSLDQAQAAATAADPNSGTSGVNVFTRKVEVSPRYAFDINAAAIYTYCNWTAEVGYNFYIRHSEKLALCGKFTDQIAIKSINGIGQLSLARNIGKNFRYDSYDVTDYSLVQIKKSDLDLLSASHPGILSNTIYGVVGYDWKTCDYPLFVSVGGSYEFTSINTAINRWTVWGKWGMSF